MPTVRQPRLTEMTLPELAWVLVVGSERGRESAAHFMNALIRQKAPLDEVNAKGETAAAILMGAPGPLTQSLFVTLMEAGASPPVGSIKALLALAHDTNYAYALIGCFRSRETHPVPLVERHQGNFLHLLGEYHIEDLFGLLNYCTMREEQWAQSTQTICLDWLVQPRDVDGRSPLHLLWQNCLRLKEDLEVDSHRQELSASLRMQTLIATSVLWLTLKNGADIAQFDHQGIRVGQLVDRCQLNTTPGSMGFDESRWRELRSEIDRALLMSPHMVISSTEPATLRRRL